MKVSPMQNSLLQLEPTKNSVNACLECGIKEITIESPINGLNLQYRLKLTKEQALQKIVESIDYAKKHGATVNFVLMDGTRTPLEDILQVFEARSQSWSEKIGDS